jgi:hypothetical protein
MWTVAPSLLWFLFVAMAVRQLLSLSQTQDLSYDITGRLHFKDSHLSFDTSGILLEKGQLSGAPSP